jgi:lysylphosphatidylglycerol synthetase-like protein (DUF2156 family)
LFRSGAEGPKTTKAPIAIFSRVDGEGPQDDILIRLLVIVLSHGKVSKFIVIVLIRVALLFGGFPSHDTSPPRVSPVFLKHVVVIVKVVFPISERVFEIVIVIILIVIVTAVGSRRRLYRLVVLLMQRESCS